MGTERAARIALIVLLTALPAAAADQESCHKLYRLTDISHAIEPGISVAATDALPAHCRVRGVVNRAIRFEVTLPEDWNGRFMFTAVGGNAGYIGDTTSLLARGFAMASTDTGHEGRDGAFLGQPEARLDHAYRGVHLATLASKRVVAHYYGRDMDRSYLKGCSNGGRAALMEAERFPDDYDGIIAGAPVFRLQEFQPWMLAVHALQEAHPLTKEAFIVLDEASRTACDTMDGVEDGVINDPRICDVDVDALVCEEGESPQPGSARGNPSQEKSPQPGEPEGGTPSHNTGCLTPGQAETARFIYADMVDADGNVLSPGVPPGAESQGDWGSWLLGGGVVPGGLGKMIRGNLAKHMRHDPTFDAAQFDPARDHARIGDALAAYDSTADLKEFRARGGKILMYQGWNDFPLRAGRAFDYLAAVEAAAGGPEQAAEFFRLFMVPGMLHCSGGPGPWQADYVDPIVQWTEEGIAPERIVATHPAEAVALPHLNPSRPPEPSRAFTRPLCVYPKLGLYRGEGDPDDESSFRCAVP